MMDVGAYLERIGYDGPVSAGIDTLRGMHRAHFYNVPFENLDIARGVEIAVDEQVNFDKIVVQRRGGFCLEVTGLFARALREIGFRVDVIGARVMAGGRLGEPMAHMTLIVHLDEPWIADVGFGARIIEPLRMAERGDQTFDGRTYVVANDGDHWFVTCIDETTVPMAYTFTHVPREFSEFAPVCGWLQTSPDSRFTGGDVVTLPTPTGRHTLAGRRLIVAEGAAREERELESDVARDGVLRERFGIVL
jgi:N-hydroxyarylamine O-acetyltransferase